MVLAGIILICYRSYKVFDSHSSIVRVHIDHSSYQVEFMSIIVPIEKISHQS